MLKEQQMETEMGMAATTEMDVLGLTLEKTLLLAILFSHLKSAKNSD